MQVLTRLPGRMRSGGALPPQRSRAKVLAHVLEHELAHGAGVRAAQANPWTGNVLVLYDPERVSDAEVEQLLRTTLADLAAEDAHGHHHLVHEHEHCGHHHETRMSA